MIKSETLINYLEKQKAKENAKLAKDLADEEFIQAELDLHEALADSPHTHIEQDLGPPWGVFRFTPKHTHFAKIYDPQAYRAYLEQTGLVRERLREDFNKRPLNVQVNRALKNPSVKMPPGVEVSTRRYVQSKRIK